MMLVTNMHWHNHVAVATFVESQIAGNEAALKTDIGQQVSQDTQQILKDYLTS